MEKEKAPVAVALVQPIEALGHRLQEVRVRIAPRVVCVPVVRKEAEEEIVLLVCEVADLQFLNLGTDRFLVAEQDGHDDKRPELVRDSGNLEIHLGQSAGRKKPGDQVIEKLEDEL